MMSVGKRNKILRSEQKRQKRALLGVEGEYETSSSSEEETLAMKQKAARI